MHQKQCRFEHCTQKFKGMLSVQGQKDLKDYKYLKRWLKPYEIIQEINMLLNFSLKFFLNKSHFSKQY